MLFEYYQFGEFEHQLLLSYAVEKYVGFAAVAATFYGQHFACAELGVMDGLSDLYGGDFGGAIADSGSLGGYRRQGFGSCCVVELLRFLRCGFGTADSAGEKSRFGECSWFGE